MSVCLLHIKLGFLSEVRFFHKHGKGKKPKGNHWRMV